MEEDNEKLHAKINKLTLDLMDLKAWLEELDSEIRPVLHPSLPKVPYETVLLKKDVPLVNDAADHDSKENEA